MKNIDIENTFSLLQFKASCACEEVEVSVIGSKSLSVKLKDGDLFLGNYNENNHHFYGYYVRTDKSGDFHKVKEPLELPYGNVAELNEEEEDEGTKAEEEPKLKVPYSALPWYIGVFHWMKSELGYHAAKLFKDEFLNGIEEYQIQSDEEAE